MELHVVVTRVHEELLSRMSTCDRRRGVVDVEASLRDIEREARAVAALNHPNIVALFDIGREDSATYVVTELLEGQTLREPTRSGRVPA